jgi:hypothetical protein
MEREGHRASHAEHQGQDLQGRRRRRQSSRRQRDGSERTQVAARTRERVIAYANFFGHTQKGD